MPYALLVIIQPGQATREFEVGDEVVAIGRALDNTICLDGDTNVSRYHAEIEKRGDLFWLLDLASSNGTTVNDVPVEAERQLQDGDLISVGGSTAIEFQLGDTPWAGKQHPQKGGHNEASESILEAAKPDVTPAAAKVPGVTGGAASDPAAAVPQPLTANQSAGGPSLMLIVAGVGGGLLFTGLVAILIWSRMAPACNPSVHIISPQTGTTIREQTPIRVEVQDAKCIDRVIYQLDGQKIASAEFAPYEFVLNPEKLPDLDGGNHLLSVTVEDKDGNKKLQAETLLLAFDSGGRAGRATPGAPPPVSIVEVRDLCINLAQEFSPTKTEYEYDAEFLRQVQTRTSDYAVEGFSERARPFRDVINTSFIEEQGLDQPLGYVLAMSRSGFSLPRGSGGPTDDPAAEGLWRMTPTFAQSNGYSGRCGTETLSDPSQRCAALVAAAYSKAIVIYLFEGDFFYAVACFGMAPREAGAWRALLPADRSNFWKVIKSTEQRERVVRFFAAGIVGENPRKFGLMKDRPLSSFYPKK